VSRGPQQGLSHGTTSLTMQEAMRSVIEVVAEERNLPQWWIEALAIEYADCREYASGEEIWHFDFTRLSEDDLQEVVNTHCVAVAGKVVHNVNIEVWRTRLIERLIGSGSAPLAKRLEDIVPDGPIAEYHFLFQGNPIEASDPKVGFSSHFQVLDNERLWQWKIADFESVEARNYGKWVSLEPEVDLESLDLVHDRLAPLRNPVIRPGQAGHGKFQQQVAEFYRWLDKLRRPILESLLEVHERRKSEYLQETDDVPRPPLLSRYDSLRVSEGEYHVDFGLEAILFFACERRVQRVLEIDESKAEGAGRIAVLDEDYGERAAAIVMGAACLEAFTNRVGRELCPKLWPDIERTNSLIAKWSILLEVKGKGDQLRLDGGLFQLLGSLKKYRDAIMHYKAEGIPITGANPPQETIVPRAFVEALPQKVTAFIQAASEAVEVGTPDWVR